LAALIISDAGFFSAIAEFASFTYNPGSTWNSFLLEIGSRFANFIRERYDILKSSYCSFWIGCIAFAPFIVRFYDLIPILGI